MKQQECSLQNIGYTYFCLGYKLARTFCQAPLVCFLFPTEKIGLQSFWRELPNSLFVLRPITDFIFIGWFDVSQRCGSHSAIKKIIAISPDISHRCIDILTVRVYHKYQKFSFIIFWTTCSFLYFLSFGRLDQLWQYAFGFVKQTEGGVMLCKRKILVQKRICESKKIPKCWPKMIVVYGKSRNVISGFFWQKGENSSTSCLQLPLGRDWWKHFLTPFIFNHTQHLFPF